MFLLGIYKECSVKNFSKYCFVYIKMNISICVGSNEHVRIDVNWVSSKKKQLIKSPSSLLQSK